MLATIVRKSHRALLQHKLLVVKWLLRLISCVGQRLKAFDALIGRATRISCHRLIVRVKYEVLLNTQHAILLGISR